MSIRQELGAIHQRAQAPYGRFVQLARSLKQVVTPVITTALKGAALLRNTARISYRVRAKALGTLLVVAVVGLLIIGLNQLIGFIDYTDSVHEWLMVNYHWAIFMGVISIVILLTWDHVSPTLRTAAGKGWFRIAFWAMVGLALASAAYIGWPREDIAYRNGYVGTITIYAVALAVLAKTLSPKRHEAPLPVYVDDDPKAHTAPVLYDTQKRLISDIRHLIAGGRPSVFAISGRWGIGKTFLLLQASRELDKNIILLEFEPWRYASEEALIRGFYQDIGTTLAKSIPGAQHITKPLAEAADKFIRQHDGTGIFGASMDAVRTLSKPGSPEEQINNLLDRERKRLIIMVDNVERSFSEERIFRTLQLAHFAKCIKNVQVIFLCEKDTILKARPTHFENTSQDAAEYLEKFIEMEIFVPAPRPHELRQHFNRLVKAHEDRLRFEVNENDLPNEMLDAIATPRSVIRLFNEFAAFKANVEESEV